MNARRSAAEVVDTEVERLKRRRSRHQNVGKSVKAAPSGKHGPSVGQGEHSDDGVVVQCGSSLTPMAVAWLWRFWLAKGKLHLLAGAPGQGKTTIALAMAATVTIGGRWPDDSRCEKGSVLIWSGEDDPGDTLLPRLIAMGADVSRVHFISGTRIAGGEVPFDPARDLAQLSATVDRIGDVRLLIVDPVVSAVAGDSHKNTEVRRAMQPLVDLATRIGAVVLGISHLSKGTAGRDPTERVTGSIAFTAIVRVVLLAAKVTSGESSRRILVRAKSNIGPDEGGFEYFIKQGPLQQHPDIEASRIEWGDAIEGTARELLAEAESESGPDGQAGARTAAADFLRQLLTAPTPSKTVRKEAEDAGHSWATVRRAAHDIGVSIKKGGMGGGWYWSLPEVAQKSSKVLTKSDEHLRGDVSTFAALGVDDGAMPKAPPVEASAVDSEEF